MATHKHIVNLADVPLDKINAPEGSPFGGGRRRAGTHIGAQKLGYSFFYVPPGKAAFPFHTHSRNEEMIYILEGEGVLRFGQEETVVGPGTIVACPAGVEFAHQLVNTGVHELRYLVVSTMDFPDICEYPDSNKVGAYATGAVGAQTGLRALYVKNQNVDYYAGEDGKEIARIMKTATRP
jgi:uncharacterized cupin superfamily protein